MLSPTKIMILEYKILLAKMEEIALNFKLPKLKLKLLCEIVILLSLACLLPLLEIVHVLIKFLQQKDVFVCNYITTIKMCQVHIYELYNDLETCFVYDVFKDSKDVMSCKHDNIYLWWITFDLDLNATCVEFLISLLVW